MGVSEHPAGEGMQDVSGRTIGTRSAWAALAVLCFGIFLSTLDGTAVSALLPTIIKDYEGAFSPTAVERAGWIVTAYLVGYTVVMPVMGRVADLFGHRRVFNVSILIFITGSVLCTLAPSIQWLAALRALQAVGGGALIPITMGILGYSFDRRQHAMALGFLVLVYEAGGALGPFYGAFMAQPVGWRGIFWINVPLCLAVMVVVWLLVPRWPRRDVHVDYRGAVLLAIFLTLVTAGLSGQRTYGWYHFVIPMLAAGAAVLVAFIRVEQRQEHPIIRLSMFRNVTFSSANLANLLEGVARITALVQVPMFAYVTRAATPIEGGLMVIRMTVMIPVGALVGGLVTNRIGHRVTAAAGFGMLALGLFLVSRWPQDVTDLVVTRDLAMVGFGLGLESPALMAAVLASVSKARLALGSSIHIVSNTTGMMVGLAALSGWGIYTFENILRIENLPLLNWQQLESEAERRSLEAILVVLHRFFLVAALLAALAIIPSLLIKVKQE